MRDQTPPRSRPASFRQRLALSRQYDATGKVVQVRPTKTDMYFKSVVNITKQRKYCGLGLLLPSHTQRLEVRLPFVELEALKAVAAAYQLTVSELVRELVSSYLDAVEEQHVAEN